MKDWTHQIINELYNEHTEIASSLKIFAKNKLCINVSDEASSRNFCNILYELEHEGLITWKARTELPNEKGEIENGLWDERLLTDAMAYGTVKQASMTLQDTQKPTLQKILPYAKAQATL